MIQVTKRRRERNQTKRLMPSHRMNNSILLISLTVACYLGRIFIPITYQTIPIYQYLFNPYCNQRGQLREAKVGTLDRLLTNLSKFKKRRSKRSQAIRVFMACTTRLSQKVTLGRLMISSLFSHLPHQRYRSLAVDLTHSTRRGSTIHLLTQKGPIPMFQTMHLFFLVIFMNGRS